MTLGQSGRERALRALRTTIRKVLNEYPDVPNEEKRDVLMQLARELEDDTIAEQAEMLRQVVKDAAGGAYCLLCGQAISRDGHKAECLIPRIEKAIE